MLARDFGLSLDGYLKMLGQQGKSAHTLSAYGRDLTELVRLLTEGSSETAQDLKRRDFVAALKRLSQQGLSERTLARKLSAWRQYCGWLVQSGMMDNDPTFNLKAPRLPERLPKALPQEELNHMLDSAPVDDSLAVRDHALFELMYGSGLRLSEIHGLDLGDVLLDEGWVSVTGKGRKERQVPLSGKSVEALRAYLSERVAADGETALFTGKNGTRLGQRQIQKRLQAWAVRQGSGQHISPHMMRHSYASHLLQSSRDIRAVQELLGHSNLSTTQIYTKLDFDHLAKVYDEGHPRAKRKK
ncbi:MAG: tyrosine recombinase XerC [Neisseria sp.]|jgi:tyrosine recombinase xerC|uniref:Tyrosine recombinase XerC n=1 Tax=Neisseria mucosa TaxID=488 RepID=A0ABM6J9V9_NEIMU|nr:MULTISPECIES: tyrosine recombinase XerC [Neisseria]ARC50263.1 tyrosine recombinase XerC [Neisseria mucosa]MDU1534016.1 tyrosine recombinase XerC [Neisseria sp.]OFM00724.1 recombinase XerC [Neisseria sp. HMSC074B07]